MKTKTDHEVSSEFFFGVAAERSRFWQAAQVAKFELEQFNSEEEAAKANLLLSAQQNPELKNESARAAWVKVAWQENQDENPEELDKRSELVHDWISTQGQFMEQDALYHLAKNGVID